jgi:hypothetical protein
MRKRVPGYITTESSSAFGLDVSVQRQVFPKSEFYSSGDPVPEGQPAKEENLAADKAYREVIPPGAIGSEETKDLDILTPPQYISTVEHYAGEQNDPKMHGSVNVQKEVRQEATPFQRYSTFQPRTAPMPRARQDDGYLGDLATMSADPLMTDADSSSVFGPREVHRKDLYGANRAGVLHNEGHPGVSAVQGEISKRMGAKKVPSLKKGYR